MIASPTFHHTSIWEQRYDFSGMFGGDSSPQVVTNDSDVALIPYAKNRLQTTPTIAGHYQIRAWHDENCIDANVNGHGDVNLHTLTQLAESWLIGQ